VLSAATTDAYVEEITAYQQKMNTEFKNESTSPLSKEDLACFEHLEFYTINQKFCVKATINKNDKPKEFGMKTTTNRLPIYIRYGDIKFEFDNQWFSIPIYKNIELSKKEEYKDHLFMLFTDLTSGKDSYAGGRYLDLRIPENQSNEIIIDFNKAYNPYCAYNSKYSCPIPSESDHLNIDIKAGVKKYH
jgi:hypothetical protein